MIQTFTLDDVVRFVYDEMNEDEAYKIREAMLFDNDLMDMYHQLMGMKNTLNANPITKLPSNSVVDRILNYSRTYDMEEVTGS